MTARTGSSDRSDQVPCGDNDRVTGQLRNQPLSITLARAHAAGRLAGVSRLSDVTGLTPFGIPVFQAVRPLATTLCVSQGKGLTPMAAMVSALLEAAELHVAENLAPAVQPASLDQLGAEALDIWHRQDRGAAAITLDRARSRGWLAGTCLMSHRSMPMPFDLAALDFTIAAAPDVRPTSSGLATGNGWAEAAAGAVAELLERDLTELFRQASPAQRRSQELDVRSIDDATVVRIVRRIEQAGYDVRLWSLGDEAGIAAIRCALVARDRPEIPPTVGSGCHPLRTVAVIRALVEAVQVHATLVAGARDDLRPDHYDDPQGRKLDLMFATLSFDRGTRDWSTVPDLNVREAPAALDGLLDAVGRRTSLPVIGIEHDTGIDGLTICRAVAPGLLDTARGEARPVARIGRVPVIARGRRPLVFIGPTLGDLAVPDGVDILPPAICGDLSRLLSDPPSAVGLVDGCFVTAPSVWHREILALLAAGIPVVGAASLGALRAAELAAFGMIGVGRIFAAYRDGTVTRDDAVMLIHAPQALAWRPLTTALVDAEEVLNRVVLNADDRRILQRIVRTTPYDTRTWRHCLDRFTARTNRPAPIDVKTLDAQPSLKQQDAMLLLQLLRDGPPLPKNAVPPPLTSHYAHLLSSISSAPR